MRGPLRYSLTILSLAASFAPLIAIAADPPGSLPVSTAVKSLLIANTESRQANDSAAMIRPEPPPATLPAERLPQYQMGYRRSDSLASSEFEDGEIRFLLAAPAVVREVGRPLLVRLAVEVDGEPFPNARQQKVDSAYDLTTEPGELLRRYAAAIGEPIAGEEADWLLTHWIDGPQLLLLHPYFQRFRADQRPAYQVLDQDRDGTVSQQEFSAAVESFQKCDANRDDIVDVLEIAKSAAALRDPAVVAVESPLLMLLSDLQQVTQDDPAWPTVYADYDADQDGLIREGEIDALRQQSPDIELAVRFNTTAAGKSTLTLVSVSPDFLQGIETTSSSDGLNVKIAGTTFSFSAVQVRAADQISLGAVIDGYPLLPELDPNDDGRFTIRELRNSTHGCVRTIWMGMAN